MKGSMTPWREFNTTKSDSVFVDNPSTMPLLLIILHFNLNAHFIIITVIHMPLYFIRNVNKSGWSGVVVKACMYERLYDPMA